MSIPYQHFFLGAGRLAETFFEQNCPEPWGRVRRTPTPLANIIGDLRTLPIHTWPQAGVVIIALTPQESSEAGYRALYEELIPQILQKIQCQRVIFISSTRVYQQAPQHEWITENSPVNNDDYGARSLLVAERAVREMSFSDHVIIRASGLYHTLNPPSQSWEKNERWANRITYHDLARLLSLVVSLEPSQQLVINATDDTPFIPAKLAALFRELRSAPSFSASRPQRSSKVSNLLMHSLGFKCTYPSVLKAYRDTSDYLKTS